MTEHLLRGDYISDMSVLSDGLEAHRNQFIGSTVFEDNLVDHTFLALENDNVLEKKCLLVQ